MAAPDEHERRGDAGERGAQPGQVGGDRRGKQFDPPAPGLEDRGEPGFQWPEVDAVRPVGEPGEGEPGRVGAEAVAVRAEAQHQVEPSLGAAGAGERGGEFLRVAPVDG